MLQLTTIADLTLDQNWLGIWYDPLPGEPTPHAGGLQPWKTISSKKNQDPFALASAFSRDVPSGKKVYILIPGKRFDHLGTRHGRGGGWYDRFLSAVPREWLRIGVVGTGSLSAQPLIRRPWDEPMDLLLASESD